MPDHIVKRAPATSLDFPSWRVVLVVAEKSEVQKSRNKILAENLSLPKLVGLFLPDPPARSPTVRDSALSTCGEHSPSLRPITSCSSTRISVLPPPPFPSLTQPPKNTNKIQQCPS
jgi:hypothetical protein